MIIFISFWKFVIFVWSFIVFTIPCLIYNIIAAIFGWKQIDLTNNKHFNLYFISFIGFIFVAFVVYNIWYFTPPNRNVGDKVKLKYISCCQKGYDDYKNNGYRISQETYNETDGITIITKKEIKDNVNIYYLGIDNGKYLWFDDDFERIAKKEVEEKYEHLQWEKEFKLKMDRERLERERKIKQLYKDAEGQRIQSINMELEKLGLQFKNIELKNYNAHTAYIQKDNKINVYHALLETEYKSFKFQISCIIFEKLELNSENLKSGIETYTGNCTYSIHPDDLDIDMLNSSNKDYINKYGCPENKNYKWFLENKKIFDKY